MSYADLRFWCLKVMDPSEIDFKYNAWILGVGASADLSGPGTLRMDFPQMLVQLVLALIGTVPHAVASSHWTSIKVSFWIVIFDVPVQVPLALESPTALWNRTIKLTVLTRDVA